MEIKLTLAELISNIVITGLVFYIIYRDRKHVQDIDDLKEMASEFNGYANDTLNAAKSTNQKLKEVVEAMEKDNQNSKGKEIKNVHIVSGDMEEAEEVFKMIFGKDADFRKVTEGEADDMINKKIIEEIDKLNYDDFIDYLDKHELKGVKLCRRILAEHNRNELVSVVDGYLKNRQNKE